MVVMKIKLYKDSAGALHASFIDGLDSVSQNNSCVNSVLVVVDGFELAQDEVLRIGYELSTGEEVVDYSLMEDNHDGTYSVELDNAITNGNPDAKWYIGLQIASNWIKQTDPNTGLVVFEGYRYKQNLVEKLTFKANNTIRDVNAKYPTRGDLSALYSEAQTKIEKENTNAETLSFHTSELKRIETNSTAQYSANLAAIDTLQGNVTELTGNDNAQKTLIEAVESQSDTNRENIEQLFGLAYGNRNEIGELSYTVDNARGADVTAAIDSDFKLTIQLVNSAGHAINRGVTIDLPLEEFVVSGVYDEESKSLVLTLKDGKTLSIPIGDLVDGLLSSSEKGQPNGVASLDENGKVFAEQLPEGIGGGLPEGFNPEDYVKFTDYATTATAGVVKINNAMGIRIDVNGALYLDTANSDEIANQKGNVAVKVDQIPKAVKSGLVKHDNITLTDEEKTSACDWLGAVKAIKTTYGAKIFRVYCIDNQGDQQILITTDSTNVLSSKKYVDDAVAIIESTVSITIEGTSTENYTANVPAYRKNDPFAYIGAVCDGDDNHVIIGYSVLYSKFILRDLETGETFKCESWNINE